MYNALIVGCGGQGALADCKGSGNEHKVISFAHALKDNGNFKVYYHDIDGSKVEKAIELWGGEWSNNECQDIVIIANQDRFHYETILKEINGNPKLIICEKPLCTRIEEAKEIVAVCKKQNISLMVNYTRRFIPELQELKYKYKEGQLGKLLDYNLAYNRGDIHTGTHMIDFMDWFFDSKYTNSLNINSMEHVPYRVWQIQLFFEKYFFNEKIIGEEKPPDYYDFHMRHVINNAYNFLEGKEELLCTGEDAIKSLKEVTKI